MHCPYPFLRGDGRTSGELDRGLWLPSPTIVYGLFRDVDAFVRQGREMICPEMMAKPVATGEHTANLGFADARVVRWM